MKTNFDSSPPYGVMSFVPLAIGALCQLMLASWTVSDVSINRPPAEKRKFDKISYPDSLRATLLQISNLGYKAFSAAHHKMMKILYLSQEITLSVNEGEKMMQMATPEKQQFIRQFVLMRLERVASAAKNCQAESNEVVKNLFELLELMEEVVEAYSLTLNDERSHEKKRRELEIHQNKLTMATLPVVFTSLLAPHLIPLTTGIALAAGSSFLQQQKCLKASGEKLNESMVQSSGCEMSPIVILENGIRVIKELIHNWRELEAICESININFKTLDKYKTTDDSRLTTSPVKHISETVLRISSVSQMVSCIAKLYVDISGKHFLPAISKMNQYSAVHPDDIEQMSRQLMESTKAAHDAIENAIENERQKILTNSTTDI